MSRLSAGARKHGLSTSFTREEGLVMRTRILVATAFAFLAALALNVAAAQQRAGEGAKIQVATKFRASHIFGMAVRNNAGKDLGTVKDLIVDMDTGQTKYVV